MNDYDADTKLPSMATSYREFVRLVSRYQEDHPVTVYAITLLEDNNPTRRGGPVPEEHAHYHYACEEDRNEAAVNFLEDSYTLRYEEPFETAHPQWLN